MIRAVIFDLGHTMWDIGPDTTGLLDAAYAEFHRNLAEAVTGAPLPEPSAVRTAVTQALAADAATYFADGPELTQPPTHIWVARGLEALGVGADEAIIRALTPPLFATEIERLIVAEGTLEAVQELHVSGLAIGCITNTLASQSTIEEMLLRHGLLACMGTVVVSAEEGVRKPHPRLFTKALAALQVDAAEALFVGDSPYHDIAAAKAVGMPAVQTMQYVTRPPVSGTPPPDATIGHLRELLPLIQRWAANGTSRA